MTGDNSTPIPVPTEILSPESLATLRYLITPIFFGVTTGPIYGGITGVMMNMAGTPDMRLRVLRHTAIFSMMGVAYGVAGLGSMWWFRKEEMMTEAVAEDYKTRFVSGCAAGATLGLANKNLMSACGACASLGLLSAVAGYFEEHRKDFMVGNPEVNRMLRPVLTKDVPDVIYYKPAKEQEGRENICT